MEELLTVDQMTQQIQTFKAELDDVKKEVKEEAKKASEKKADEEKEKVKEADNDTPKEKALMKAAETEDPKERMVAMRKAMEIKDEEKKADEDKKEVKEELQTLRKEASKSKLTYLASVYKNSNITKEKFIELSASWMEMSLPQLDAEIDRVTPFVEHTASSIPVSPSKSMFEFNANTTNSKLDEIENMSGADLFNQRGNHYA